MSEIENWIKYYKSCNIKTGTIISMSMEDEPDEADTRLVLDAGGTVQQEYSPRGYYMWRISVPL